MKKVIQKIRRFLFAVTHCMQMLEENLVLSRANINLTDTLRETEQKAEDAEQRAKDMEVESDDWRFRANELRVDLDSTNSYLRAYKAALTLLLPDELDTETAQKIYSAASSEIDPEGWILFETAEKILGKFSYSAFAYEDNLGCFEEADGHTMLSYLLVQHDYELGDANDRNRWEIACSCYEKCVDFTIDKTTPEYQEFERKLYVRVLERMGILEPTEKQKKEVAL